MVACTFAPAFTVSNILRLHCNAVLDVMRRLLQPKNIMVSAHARTKEYDKSKYISILNIIQVSTALYFIICDALWMSDMHAVSSLSFQALPGSIESWD